MMSKFAWINRIKNFFSTNQMSSPLPKENIKNGIWYHLEDNGNYLLGLDPGVLSKTGKIEYVHFLITDKEIHQDESFIEVTGENSSTILTSPISGIILSKNPYLNDNLSRLNYGDPHENWLLEVAPNKG